MIADTIAEFHEFGPVQKKFSGWVQEGRIAGEKILLLKPATFMNKSGIAVGEAMRFYKLEPGALTVFHDELDLVPFKVKVKTGGGHAGHNGLRSIDQHIGPDSSTGLRGAFRRIRLGIGHPGHKERVHGHVLGNYTNAEMDGLADLLGAVAAEADWLAKHDDVRFANDVALRLQR